MRDAEAMGCSTTPEWIKNALHELCQPVTALECGLFVGMMGSDGIGPPKAEELIVTIRGAMEQCERISGQLRAMQARIQSDTN